MVSILVEYDIPRPIIEVESILSDFSNYPNWWNDYNAKYEDGLLLFKPAPLIQFKLKLTLLKKNIIKVEYINSPIRGYGIWETHHNKSNTKVSYTINIYGRTKVINLIINSSIFKWKHKRDIMNLMKKLEVF